MGQRAADLESLRIINGTGLTEEGRRTFFGMATPDTLHILPSAPVLAAIAMKGFTGYHFTDDNTTIAVVAVQGDGRTLPRERQLHGIEASVRHYAEFTSPQGQRPDVPVYGGIFTPDMALHFLAIDAEVVIRDIFEK